MKTVKVIALQEHPYAGKIRRTGDVYDMNEVYVKTMTVRRRVKVLDADKPKEAKPEPGRYNRRDMRVKE